LSVLSKLLKRLVNYSIVHLTACKLLPALQFAYRAHHSTETAVLKVLGDILRAIDSGDIALLTMLFSSYLDGRTQSVLCGPSSSTSGPVLCGVSQGLVFGPIPFLLYTADLL